MSKFITYFCNFFQEQFFQLLCHRILFVLGFLIDRLMCRLNRKREFQNIEAFVDFKLCTIRNNGNDLIVRYKNSLTIDTIICIYKLDKDGFKEYIALGYIANTQENNICTIRLVHKIANLDIKIKYLYSTRLYRTQSEILLLFNDKERKL